MRINASLTMFCIAQCCFLRSPFSLIPSPFSIVAQSKPAVGTVLWPYQPDPRDAAVTNEDATIATGVVLGHFTTCSSRACMKLTSNTAASSGSKIEEKAERSMLMPT